MFSEILQQVREGLLVLQDRNISQTLASQDTDLGQVVVCHFMPRGRIPHASVSSSMSRLWLVYLVVGVPAPLPQKPSAGMRKASSLGSMNSSTQDMGKPRLKPFQRMQRTPPLSLLVAVLWLEVMGREPSFPAHSLH